MMTEQMLENGEGQESEEARTNPEISNVVQEVLKHGYIEGDERAVFYESAKKNVTEINRILEPLGFRMKIDDNRGLLILMILEPSKTSLEIDEAWSHPLVRRQRLTLEQSLLLAILRRYYVVQEQEVGIGMSAVKVYVEDLVKDMETFIGDSGSDQKNERRVLHLLDQLKGHGIVSEPDKNEEVTIRPLIIYLADPDNLKELLKQYQQVAESSNSEDSTN
jgi:hypothetical protein